MTTQQREQLGAHHDQLCEQFNNETDPAKQTELYEQIAVIEMALVWSRPPSTELTELEMEQ